MTRAKQRRRAAALLALLSACSPVLLPIGPVGAKTHDSVPRSWKTYGYREMLISVPATWYVWANASPCYSTSSNAPGLLVLGVQPGVSSCPAGIGGPRLRSLVAVTDVPTNEYGPGPYVKAHIVVNGIGVYVHNVTGQRIWIIPGTEEVRGSGPDTAQVLHTIRPT